MEINDTQIVFVIHVDDHKAQSKAPIVTSLTPKINSILNVIITMN